MAQELTFNISEDRRNLQGPVEAKNFNLKFGTDDVAITNGNPKQWVQGRIGDNELKQVFVNITEGENNTPKDVAGLFLAFVGIIHDKDGRPHRVVDYKHSTTIDVEHGRFRFDFPDQAFTVAGEYQQAFFMLVKEGPGGGCVATMEFDMQVMANFVFTDLVPEDYITPFNDTVDQLLAACKKFKDDTAADEAKFKQELEDAYAKFQKDTNTQLNNFKDATDEDLANFKKANADDIAKFKQQYADAVQAKEDELQSKVDSYTDKIDTMLKDLNQQGIDTTTLLTTLQANIKSLEDKIKQDGLFTSAEAKKFEDSIQQKFITNYDNVGLMKKANLQEGQYVGTRGYYSAGDGGNAHYLVQRDRDQNCWNEELDNGLYAKLITDNCNRPEQFGAHLDGVNSDSQAVQAAINGGNVVFPQGSKVVVDSPIVLPQKDRIIDFNNSDVHVKNGSLIKVGDSNDTTYHHTFIIKNAKLEFEDVSSERSAFNIFNTYNIRIENITVNNAVDNITVFDFNDCFNMTVNNCFVGSGTGSLKSTAGIRVRETNIPNSQNNFPNNTTNLKIANCLMQNLDRGYDLDGMNGMIDSTVIDNCGASSCNYGYVISGADTTVGVSLRNCRSELAKKADLLLDSDATISNFHSYSDGSTPVGIKVTNNAMHVVFLGYISFDGHYSENAFTCAGAVNASSALFRIFNGEKVDLKNVVFPWRPDIIIGSLSKLNNFLLHNLRVLCVDDKFDISTIPTDNVSDGLQLLVTMQNTGNTYKLIYHDGWQLQGHHLDTVNTQGAIKLKAYYNTPDKPFIAPSDGYVTLQSLSMTDIWQLNMKEEMMLRAKDCIVSMPVKKGMDMYLTSTGEEGDAYFFPVESN